MKIGILTQPLRSNYGGILQNWALQQVLIRLGHEPVTIGYGPYTRRERFSMYLRWLAHQILHTPGRKNVYKAGKDDYKFAALTDFCFRNIAMTGGKLSCNERDWTKDACDAYIVGSDQVWRPCYNHEPSQLEAMFGGFVPEGKPIIAYAASLGADKWEMTVEQTEMASRLVKRFSAISVRENDAVNLLKEKFGIDSVSVLDPTLLLGAKDYEKLFTIKQPQAHTLAAYILDSTDEKITKIKEIAQRLGLRLQMVGEPDPDGVKPSIEIWLAGIASSDYVVTDSFHGTVFSIIFHRPFTILKNERRGSSRINSLLDNLNLTDRISPKADEQPIDWASVDNRLAVWKAESMKFLTYKLK